MKKKSLPQLFIIESLRIQDEEAHIQEGDIISRMLTLSGKKDTKYFYIRTHRELQEIAKLFRISSYRYLHIACHANECGIDTTFETISNPALSAILRDCLYNTRLFVAACEMANKFLAERLFRETKILSFAGPSVAIRVDDAAALVSFYHLMFKKDDGSMENKDVRDVLNKLSNLYSVKINFFVRKRTHGLYNMYTFPTKDEGTSCQVDL